LRGLTWLACDAVLLSCNEKFDVNAPRPADLVFNHGRIRDRRVNANDRGAGNVEKVPLIQ
jgi:hypothetical protein